MKQWVISALSLVTLLTGQILAQEAPPAPKWTGNVSANASVQSGNTDRRTSSISALAVHKAEKYTITTKFLNNYADEKIKGVSAVKARNTYAMGKYDRILSEKLYATGALELYNDEFMNLQLRTIVSAGMGYQMWKDDIKSLQFEVGAANINSNLRINNATNKDKSWTTAKIAVNARYKLSDIAVFTDSLLFYPSFQAENGGLLRNEATATKALSTAWAVKLTNIIDRNNKPQKGLKKTDQTWILALQYTF